MAPWILSSGTATLALFGAVQTMPSELESSAMKRFGTSFKATGQHDNLAICSILPLSQKIKT